jgi:membrane-bound lytic murein transglycosylase B
MERRARYAGNKVFIMRRPKFRISTLLLPIVLLLIPRPAFADWSPLVDRLVADGFNESVIRELFSRPEVRFEPGAMSSKLEELLKIPPGNKPWTPTYNPKSVYKGHLKGRTIDLARSYLRENSELLEEISGRYCVPREIIVSVLLIETRLGECVGRKWAFNFLASMALCTDLHTIRSYLPKKLINAGNEALASAICWKKSDWAFCELEALLRYADLNGFDPLSLPGSIYGAIGICQFMPSNSFLYAVDGNEDGRIDLFGKPDALHSIANYLRHHGWEYKREKARQFRVILDYNKSSVYANTVLAVAERLKDPPRQAVNGSTGSRRKALPGRRVPSKS